MSRTTNRYIVGLAAEGGAEGFSCSAVLASIGGSGEAMRVRQVRHELRPYDDDLRRRVPALAEGADAAERSAVNERLGEFWGDAAADVLKASRVPRARIAGVGFDGQPLGSGRPARRIGSAAAIARRTRLPVVSDFAAGDIAAGGRGWPLAAWSDYVLLHDTGQKARVLVDVGRVATLTFLPAGGLPADTLVFDTGPGTVWTDALARRHFARPCDVDGTIAAAGSPSEPMLAELLGDAWFRRPGPNPKTFDPRQWGGIERLEALSGTHRVSSVDLMATACELSARSIALAIRSLTQNPHEVILCGGGARNVTLAMRLRRLLTPASTVPIERFDIDAAAKDALGIAVLAAARLDGVPANIPALTGALGPASLEG